MTSIFACGRIRAGLLTVYTPYASLIHYELASRASMKDVYDLTHFDAAWKTMFAAGDPYFNPRLSKQAADYRPDDEPVQWVVAGTPLFDVAEIARILVVKLDHIGDFVTALPPDPPVAHDLSAGAYHGSGGSWLERLHFPGTKHRRIHSVQFLSQQIAIGRADADAGGLCGTGGTAASVPVRSGGGSAQASRDPGLC